MSLRSFGKNAILYSFGSISVRITTFLLIPIQTHFLSINEFGLLSTLLLTARLLGIIMEFGVQDSLLRFSKEYEENNRENTLLGTSITLNSMGILLISAITFLFLNPFLAISLNTQISNQMILLVCIIAATQQALITYPAYFRIKNEIKWFILSNLFSAILLVSTSIIFLGIFKKGIWGALISYSIAYSTTIMLVLFRLFKLMGFRFDKKIFIFFMRFNFPLIFGKSGDTLFSTSSLYIIGHFTGLHIVGMFSLAHKLTSIVSTAILQPFHAAYDPYVYSNLNDRFLDNKISKIYTYFLLAVTIVSSLLVFLAKDGIVVLSSREYSDALLPFILLLPLVMLYGLKIIANSLLLIGKKTKLLGYLPMYILLIFIFISYFLTSIISFYGVILANYLAIALVTSILIYFGRREFSVRFETTKIFIILSLFIANIISIYLVEDISNIYYYTIVPAILIILNYYIISNYLLTKKEKKLLINWIVKTKNRLLANS